MSIGWSDPVLEFVELVEAIARQIPAIRRTERVPGELALRVFVGPGDPATFFLHNLFHETRLMPPDAQAHRIHHYLASFAQALAVEGAASWATARPRLLPAVRHVELVANAAAGVGGPKGLVHRPFVDGVAECVVIDDEASMAYATTTDLSRWGVDDRTAIEQARHNLAARAYHGIEPVTRSPYLLLQVASRDDYESSRAVLPGWLASFAAHVGGTPVCAFPERSTLFVTVAENPAALAHLLALAHHHFTSSTRSISPLPYVALPDGRLTPLVLPHGHPSAASVAHAARAFASRLPT